MRVFIFIFSNLFSLLLVCSFGLLQQRFIWIIIGVTTFTFQKQLTTCSIEIVTKLNMPQNMDGSMLTNNDTFDFYIETFSQKHISLWFLLNIEIFFFSNFFRHGDKNI